MGHMREFELYEPVKVWLERAGYTVYPEVACNYARIDVVGRKEYHLVSVELKTALTKHVIHQTYMNTLSANVCYAAIPTSPKTRSLEMAKSRGIGVIRVHGGRVTMLLAPNHERTPMGRHHAQLIECCQGEPTPGVGGMPNVRGEGPAQQCAKDVAEYRTQNPSATWAEVFRDVPNHYANAKSMQGSLRILRERLAIRDRAPKC